MNELQKRHASVELQTRAVEDSQERVIEGYFALFNTETELFPGFFESILPGAFDDTVSGDIRALIDHDHAKVLGRTKSRTLDLKVDSRGLYGTIRINENDREAMDLYERVKRGDVDQCSFGFYVQDEEIDYGDNGTIRSKLKKVDVIEVSVVTFPQYAETSVSARKKDVEQFKYKQLDARKKRMKERMKQWH
ncbi:putative prohead protease [Exiguobacterium phage vB_EauS-123]|nr:putative prohead protease [Exiguobacterium phage vB_EauS-123]